MFFSLPTPCVIPTSKLAGKEIRAIEGLAQRGVRAWMRTENTKMLVDHKMYG
jgi:aerobic-type carbon monoxide dehydrogenase small subunit (CoxS/CutS family)